LLLEHSGSGDLYAIDPANGTVKYQRKVATIPSMVAALPLGKFAIVSGGQTDTSVVAIRASDGQTLWQQEFPNASGIGDCPAVSDGTRVFCNYVRPVAPATFVQVGTSVTEHAYALDAVTGQPVWDVALEVGKAPTRNLAAIPLLDGGTLFFGNSTAPWMHALDAETGKVRWRTHVRGPVKGGVVAVGGAVYFGDHGGYLWALDEQTGHVIGVKNMHTPFNVGSPLVVGRTLVIGSLTGRLIAVPLDVIRSAHDPAVKAPAEKP